MSMERQVREANGKSSFAVVEQYEIEMAWPKGQFKAMAKVQGPYGVSSMEVGKAHQGCEFGGFELISHDAWAMNSYCSGCNYSVYYPLGD